MRSRSGSLAKKSQNSMQVQSQFPIHIVDYAKLPIQGTYFFDDGAVSNSVMAKAFSFRRLVATCGETLGS